MRPCAQFLRRRRGAVAVLTAVTIVVLLLFSTLAVDLGFVRAVCGDMQNSADAAALAGATALQEFGEAKDADAPVVKERAREVIELMHDSQGFSEPGNQTIEVGTWNPKTGEFLSIASSGTNRPFAVRVVSVRDNTPLFFAAVMGKYKTRVVREAIAQGSGYCDGIWGLRGVRVIGSIVTDSYESNSGSYDASDAGDDGDLCSGRALRISGASEINGDAMAGMGYAVEINGGAADITGFTSSNSMDITGPTVDPGSAEYVNNNNRIGSTSGGRSAWKGGGIELNANDNLTLPPGTYYFDSITMRSGATITIVGETTIYVEGAVAAAGAGIVNRTGSPSKLSVYSMGTSFQIGGTYDFYGSVLAPKADVVVYGDSEWYGRLIGGTVLMRGNAEFHVDKSTPQPKVYDLPPVTLVK